MSLETWMREVRRLSTVVGRLGTFTPEVSLSHLTIQPPGKPPRLTWRASCSVTSTEAETAEAAMRDLLSKLTEQLDERIKAQKGELTKLQDARRNGLKIVDAE